MICTVDVDIQSANPDFPLKEWKAFKGSPTSIRIRNVPRRVGAWDITAVSVKCVYPDNTAHVVAAVLTGCVWVATITASDAVGFVEGGYSIEADGTDERGNVVTGYRLGEGKVTILDVAASAHAVDGIEFMRVFDTKPDAPLKGDFALDVMEFYDGETWRGFSAPADYNAVRQNAATGAVHASTTGNPHGTEIDDIGGLVDALGSLGGGIETAAGVAREALETANSHKEDTSNPHATTAEQVGFRVVELVVEGDAKKLYLTLNGERTTERVTSYAALLAMAKRGLVRLYYNAVGGTGRKALYTPHMVDDNGTPAMRFDATGTLGEKVYTRSIAITKTGADGIVVTVGTLTEIAKASAMEGKLDKSGGTMTGDFRIEAGEPILAVSASGTNYASVYVQNEKHNVRITSGAEEAGEAIEPPKIEIDGESVALISDIADATKLTSVYGEWVLGNHFSEYLFRNISATYNDEKKGWDTSEEMSTDGGETWTTMTIGAEANPDPDRTATSVTCVSATFTRAIVGYTTANGEYVSAQTVEQITKVAEAAVEDKITTEDASLVALIKKYGGTQIKEDEKGFYYEVEEA